MCTVKNWSKVTVVMEFWNTTHFVFWLIYDNHLSINKGINAAILLDCMHRFLSTESLNVYFHFPESRILWPPSNKWHDKQTTIMFHITNITLSDRIFPIECTYVRIESLLWLKQILLVVKVRAIWKGKNRAPLTKNDYCRLSLPLCFSWPCVVRYMQRHQC